MCAGVSCSHSMAYRRTSSTVHCGAKNGCRTTVLLSSRASRNAVNGAAWYSGPTMSCRCPVRQPVCRITTDGVQAGS